MPNIITDEAKSIYQTGEPGQPWTCPECGAILGVIHHDDKHVPYLLVMGKRGATWRIYGYAQIACRCGGGGEWLPSRSGMLKVIEAWRKGRAAARRARVELGVK